MFLKIKKRVIQAALIVMVLATVVFSPNINSEKIKSYLSRSTTSSYNVENVWGQAYSSSIGWINFYCDGAGHTQPSDIRTKYSAKGAATMPSFCASTPYSVTYNPNTQTFSGVAYSSNYGWLDMNGLKMVIPTGGLISTEITGSTSGSSLGSSYNFGTTYFQANQPNSNNLGVRYYNDKGYFCGFAYSDGAGFISFCDPRTKEKAPNNISKVGYDFSTYAIYMGLGDVEDVSSVVTGTIGAPVLTTPAKVFAATNNYSETLLFKDDVSDVTSANVKILDSSGIERTYTASSFDPIQKLASVIISGHDFHAAGNYDLKFTVCDHAGNCDTDQIISNFFHVVAAPPSFSSPANSFFEFGAPAKKIADGANNYFVQTNLVDRYGNPVVSVAGIKNVGINFKFDNTTQFDQIAGTGDSVGFTADEFGFDQEGGISTGNLTEVAGGDGVFQVKVRSFAPTSNGYVPIKDDGRNIYFKEITFTVAPLSGYVNVGESSGTYGSTDENRKFAFEPALISNPQALIWNSATSVYEVDSGGVKNITVNATKRFGISFENKSSSKAVSSPKIGIAVDSGVSSSITWINGFIEKAGSAISLTEALDLDIDANSDFNKAVKNLSSWISSIDKSSVDNTFRFRLTPQLATAASMTAGINTILETYVCYTVSGKNVCHRGEKLTGDSAAGASLYNPSIEIIGSVHSGSEITARRSDVALSRSLGDVARNEYRSNINRNTAVLTKSGVTACTTDTIIRTVSELTSLNCKHQEGNVFYFKGADVTLDLSAGLLDSAKTILIEGGDLHIKNNLTYASAGGSLGIIVLKNGTSGGNVFVYPNVTSMVGAFYTEGSLISVNARGQFGEDLRSNCDGSMGFCDRSFELKNQLYWKGLIATANTIGGSDLATPKCPDNVDCASDEARKFDLTYFRTFHPASGGIQVYSGNDAAFVMEYDARVQNTPPPLFGTLHGTGGSQLGGDLVEVLE